MPRLLYSTGEPSQPYTIYYQNFNGAESLARPPGCGRHTALNSIPTPDDELGVTWFRCKECDESFKAPGLYQPISRG